MSARHGFISAQAPIAVYDQRMESEGGPPTVKLRSQLSSLTAGKSYSAVFINLGVDYISRLPDLKTVLDGSPAIRTAQGRIGQKLHEMKEWLFNG